MSSHTVALVRRGYAACSKFLLKWLLTFFFLAWDMGKRLRGWWRRRGRA